jgi:hypothetical protein
MVVLHDGPAAVTDFVDLVTNRGQVTDRNGFFAPFIPDTSDSRTAVT